MNLQSFGRRATIGYSLETLTNDELDLDLLKAYLDAEDRYGDAKTNTHYQALKIKYEALTTAPTVIEKTMSPAQLYVADNPLWAYDYSADGIREILRRLEDKPKTEESFHVALDETRQWFGVAQSILNEGNE